MSAVLLSKMTLPSGVTVEIKDAEARRLIAGGISFIICWDGTSAPDVSKIPAGIVVVYNDVEYTGTMPASSAGTLSFYLVKSPTQVGVADHYDEYVAARSGAGTELDPFVYFWEKIGDTRLDLSDLGALAYKDNVTLSKGSGDNVLGEDTTFTNASSAVSFGQHTTDGVLGSDATFGATVTASKTNVKATATPTTSKLATTSIPNVTNAGAPSTWNFAMGSGDDADTLIISGGNGSAPTLGTAITAATGSLDVNGSGDSVMTGVSVGLETGATAGTGVVSLATDIDSASVSVTNKDEVNAITVLGSATAAAQTITVGSNDKVKVAKYDDLSVSAS